MNLMSLWVNTLILTLCAGMYRGIVARIRDER